MKVQNFEGSVAEYQGKALAETIKFDGQVEVYENVAEFKGSEDYPSDGEILKMVNAKLVAGAKAKAYQDATKELKKEYENSSDFKRANLIKAAVGAGFTQAEAEALADSKL